jgi:hypothetical protein
MAGNLHMKLRFSIRDLLWLTLVVGMAVAWWIDHRYGAHYVSRYTVTMVESATGEPAVIRDNVTGKYLAKYRTDWAEYDYEPKPAPGWNYVR